MLTPGEYKILKKIADCQVVTREELIKVFDTENPKTIVDAVVKSLLEKNYIATASPIGSTCFVITKHGTKVLENY